MSPPVVEFEPKKEGNMSDIQIKLKETNSLSIMKQIEALYNIRPSKETVRQCYDELALHEAKRQKK